MSSENELNTMVVTKVTAELNHIVSIDKIDFTTGLTKKATLLQYWIDNGIYHDLIESEYTSDISLAHITFKVSPGSKNYLYKITTNPNNFSSYEEYLSVLKRVVPDYLIHKMTIQQIDLSFDILNRPFKQIDQSLTIPNKQIVERIVLKSHLEKTRYFGEAKSERFRFYDKKRQIQKLGVKSAHDKLILKLKHCTRLEVSLTNHKLPTKDIDLLKGKLLDPSFNPFKNSFINNYVFRPEKNPKHNHYRNSKELVKFIRLVTLIEYCGLQYAKKVLNKSRSFKRDYGYFMKHEPKICLGNFFNKGVIRYFNNRNFEILASESVDNER